MFYKKQRFAYLNPIVFLYLSFIKSINYLGMSLINQIKKLAHEYCPDVIEWRRHLHQHPELSFEEVQTSLFVQERLKEFGIPYKAGIAKTGILGCIQGVNPDKYVVALRADMDALPICEAEGNAFRSQNQGVMHACGHDAHTAALLGTARILNSLKDQIEGTVLLIFQPGEESSPGGARLMLEDGLFADLEPNVVVGAHVLPSMPTGHVGFREGFYMASGDEVYLTVKGQGGHGGMPHLLTDNVLVAANILVSLQQIVSRVVPATVPAVLSFGRFIANGATNIIPEKVELAGTLRTLDETWRGKVKEKIVEMASHIAIGMGASCEAEVMDGYPAVYNHVELTRDAKQLAVDFLGQKQVEEMDIRMTAEDFGFYSKRYPSVFYRFGVQQSDGSTGNLHTPAFNLNEQALETASGVMAQLAVGLLASARRY